VIATCRFGVGVINMSDDRHESDVLLEIVEGLACDDVKWSDLVPDMIGLLKSPDEGTVDLVKTWLGLLAREADYLKGMVQQMTDLAKAAKKEIDDKEEQEFLTYHDFYRDTLAD